MASQAQLPETGQDATSSEGLFEGVTFWLSAAVPTKQSYIEKIRANGGTVTKREADATLKIADHLRSKNAPPDSLSYKFIDESIRAGALVDLSAHRIYLPANAPRPVGEVTQATRTTRSVFTAEDDRVLRDWVRDHAAIGGKNGSAGNELYKQLESHNPRHTWQSWRDRYVKRMRNSSNDVSPRRPQAEPDRDTEYSPSGHRTRTFRGIDGAAESINVQTSAAESGQLLGQGHVLVDAAPINGVHNNPTIRIIPASEPTLSRESGASGLSAAAKLDAPVEQEEGESTVNNTQLAVNTTSSSAPQEPSSSADVYTCTFGKKDFENLRNGAKDIFRVDEDRYEEAWEVVARKLPHHTADEWRFLWESKIRSEYLRARAKRREDGCPSSADEQSQDTDSHDQVPVRGEDYDEADEDKDASEHENGDSKGSETQLTEASLQETNSETPRASMKRRSGDLETESPAYERPGSPDALRQPSNKRVRIAETAETDASYRTPGDETQYFSVPAEAVHPVPVDLTEMSDGPSSSQNSQEVVEQTSNDETNEEYHSFEESDPGTPTPLWRDQPNPNGRQSTSIERNAVATVRELPVQPPSSSSASEALIESTGGGEEVGEHERQDSQQIDRDRARSKSQTTSQADPLFNPAALRESPALPITLREANVDDEKPSSPDALDEMDVVENQNAEPVSITPTAAAKTAVDYEKHMEEFETRHLGLGVSRGVLDQAFRAASGNLAIADEVVRSIQAGRGIPQRVKGIWTDEDDDHLIASRHSDADAWISIVNKHGEALAKERMGYLEAQENDDDDDMGSDAFI